MKRPTSIGLGSTKSNDLTKREHFAGLAMQGLCAWGANDFNFDHVERIAKISIAQADALIAELNKSEQ
jgi:hypothetical protein